MQFTFTTQLLKEGETFVAYSPELDLSSCGQTTEEARQRLQEAVELFIDEAQKMGTLEIILEEAGFQKANNKWEAPEFIGFERTALAF